MKRKRVRNQLLYKNTKVIKLMEGKVTRTRLEK